MEHKTERVCPGCNRRQGVTGVCNAADFNFQARHHLRRINQTAKISMSESNLFCKAGNPLLSKRNAA